MKPTRAYNSPMTRACAAVLIGVLAMGSSACRDRSSPARPPAPVVNVAIPEDGFVYAEVVRQPAPVPPRFAAELPAQVGAFAGEWTSFPPRDYIADQLCAGGDDMRSRFLRALTGAAASAELGELIGNYAELFGACATESFCAWAAGVVASEQPLPVRQVVWHGLARCTDRAYAGAFAKPEAPADAVINWTQTVADEYPPPLSDRLIAAAEEKLAAAAMSALRRAALAIGASDDPRVAKALTRLIAVAPDRASADVLALGLYRQVDSSSRQRFEAACERSDDAVCMGEGEAASAPLPDPVSSPELALLDYRVEPHQVVERHRGERLVAALAGCVGKSLSCDAHSDWITYRCLAVLEPVDRQAAVTAGKRILAARVELPLLRQAAQTLIDFPTREALLARLAELGLIGAQVVPRDQRHALLTVIDVLEAVGAYYRFDTQIHDRAAHASVLRRLAAMVAGGLGPVLFEHSRTSTGYQLDAYVEGLRYRSQAIDYDGWYDVAGLVGLVNSILADRGSELRLALVPTGDQTSAVVAGSALGIGAARRHKLLGRAGPDDGRAVGMGAYAE